MAQMRGGRLTLGRLSSPTVSITHQVDCFSARDPTMVLPSDWCFVNLANCLGDEIPAPTDSSYFHRAGEDPFLFYSYETCNGDNVILFTDSTYDEQASNEEHSEVITLLGDAVTTEVYGCKCQGHLMGGGGKDFCTRHRTCSTPGSWWILTVYSNRMRLWLEHGIGCLHPARCYRITIEGLTTAR